MSNMILHLRSSLLEAMAVGTFPIVTDIEANRYWANMGCSMLLFDPYNVDDLVDKILTYYHNCHGIEGLLAANRKVVEEKASWVDNMNVLENLFAELVKQTIPELRLR